MNAQGVDISVWQDNNSTPQMFDPLKARRRGASFVGIKISQANWADPDYMANWSNCKRHLYRMPFHFLTWDISPKRQAEVFWSLIEKDTFGLLPLMCDFEWWKTTPVQVMDILYNFMERLKALSSPLPLGIYSAKTFWDPNGSQASYWSQFNLWLCDVIGQIEIPKPWNRWDFHQYTFKLNGPEWGAESLGLDGDYYNGTLEEMKARYGLPDLDGNDQVAEPVGKMLTTTTAGVGYRKSPQIGNNLIARLPKGTQGCVIETRQDGRNTWNKVQVEGWIASMYDGAKLAEVK